MRLCKVLVAGVSAFVSGACSVFMFSMSSLRHGGGGQRIMLGFRAAANCYLRCLFCYALACGFGMWTSFSMGFLTVLRGFAAWARDVKDSERVRWMRKGKDGGWGG